ncbi:hypothetical protein TRAPUB_7788 [Trametes pubescens]|uniref:Uncharacterized protein n=1 Tax=Trametes pubescens TaxID=154538 RepID=A0A1M2V2B4_TRAPU|nr:hypothetical protein TRAPUB_7788 [Trametes pubescens]
MSDFVDHKATEIQEVQRPQKITTVPTAPQGSASQSVAPQASGQIQLAQKTISKIGRQFPRSPNLCAPSLAPLPLEARRHAVPPRGRESDRRTARTETIGDSPKQCSPIPRRNTISRRSRLASRATTSLFQNTTDIAAPPGAKMHGRGPAESIITTSRLRSPSSAAIHAPPNAGVANPRTGPPAPRAAAAKLCVHRHVYLCCSDGDSQSDSPES